MKNFIEVHDARKEGTPQLINVNHIVDVIGHTVYTDDILPDAHDFSYITCVESYEEIKALIERAVE